ncbi:MAG: hypothetical protein FIB06_06045 [Betaproteobacteria bacterium]|nr:hypothetical protein [Betaproteobacteria bacterium]
MRVRHDAGRRERGAALVLLLVALILAGTYALYRGASQSGARAEREARVARALAAAKDALIARAVADANRPGSLPCPDLVTNSAGLANIPGDGKADLFTMTQCPSYVGWLPWITLDLPELQDDTGTRLWYVLAPSLRDDDSAQPINSDTVPALSLDGAGGIAALVIAAGTPLGSQSRPSNNPADYLDGENGNGSDGIYVSGPRSATFNDQVVAITRRELMAAVEKRVAGEVRACLEQHASTAANTAHTYPWPSPFAATGLRGSAGSLFGQIPATQAGPGPEQQLREAANSLASARNTLATASTAADQLAATQVVADAAAFARAYFDKLYVVAATLATTATAARGAFGTLDGDIDVAASNNRISRTERTALRAEAITVIDSLTALQSGLADSGIDPYPGELLARSLALQQGRAAVISTPTAATLGALAALADGATALFALSTTPNPDITAALASATTASASAAAASRSAAASASDTTLLSAAVTAAQSLESAIGTLRDTITTRRVNVVGDEISAAATRVTTARTAFASAPGNATASTLATAVSDLNTLVSGVTTASSPVVAARAASLAANTDATAALAGASDNTAILTTTATVATSAGNLATAIAGNGDNVARTSLDAARGRYVTAQTSFNNVTGITQAAMVPYVRALQGPGDEILFWSALVANNATDIASRARKAPGAATDDNASAYVAADSLLTGITGSGGTQAALQAYIDSPTSASRQAVAAASLATTLSNIDSLQGLGTALDGALDSGAAAAQPTVWYGTACDFLQPTSGTSSWWTANNWTATVFYQISDRVRPATGRLTVNGAGANRVIVAAAGGALAGQNRGTRISASFLEGINADASRDGPADNPSVAFANMPASATFNDRLSY